ncbi:hypothetical protein GCM10023082_20080 [Streptomyces tremellae]|uniref:Uncharacterized protein n=1 Tax=Streptomyces tremellae TaxID=1124239 RepID=A0ABP7EP49_9ACTN
MPTAPVRGAQYCAATFWAEPSGSVTGKDTSRQLVPADAAVCAAAGACGAGRGCAAAGTTAAATAATAAESRQVMRRVTEDAMAVFCHRNTEFIQKE